MPRAGGDGSIYQPFVKIRLDEAPISLSSRRKPGPILRCPIDEARWLTPCITTDARGYGSRVALALLACPGRQSASIQIDIELVGAVGADQRQLQRRAVGTHAGRHAFEQEREALHAGRAVLDRLRDRQAPVRRRAFDEKVDGP